MPHPLPLWLGKRGWAEQVVYNLPFQGETTTTSVTPAGANAQVLQNRASGG